MSLLRFQGGHKTKVRNEEQGRNWKRRARIVVKGTATGIRAFPLYWPWPELFVPWPFDEKMARKKAHSRALYESVYERELRRATWRVGTRCETDVDRLRRGPLAHCFSVYERTSARQPWNVENNLHPVPLLCPFPLFHRLFTQHITAMESSLVSALFQRLTFLSSLLELFQMRNLSILEFPLKFRANFYFYDIRSIFWARHALIISSRVTRWVAGFTGNTFPMAKSQTDTEK